MNLRVKQVLTVTIFATIGLLPYTADAGTDPAWQWKTFTTPHFFVHWYPPGEPTARKVAQIAEEVFDIAVFTLKMAPKQKIHVLVMDNSDSANGWAKVFPYDTIMVLAVPPGPDSSLSNFDDHIRVLIAHELTHILNMDQVSGIPKAINTVLGDLILPNASVSTWFLEGLAVYMESHLSGKGRVGSSLHEMILRSAVLGDTFLDISELTAPPMKMPRASAPYVYGSAFMTYLIERFGMATVSNFVADYGKRLVPYAMNILARRHFGATFVELYDSFSARVAERAHAFERDLRRRGERAGVRITNDGEFDGYPVFSEDGSSLFFVRSDGVLPESVVLMDLSDGSISHVALCDGGCERLVLNGRKILTVHQAPYRWYSTVGDVYATDQKSAGSRRITKNARARDIASDGRGNLLWVTSQFDQVALVQATIDGVSQEYILDYGMFQSIGYPVAVPDSDMIVFSGARNGRWDLWGVNRQDHTLIRLTDDDAIDQSATISADGRTVVWSSDMDGTYNIYSMDLATRQRYRITDVAGGAFQPTISPDKKRIAFSTYDHDGYDIAIIEFTPIALVPAPESAPSESVEQTATPVFDGPARRYSPWPSMRPRHLFPSAMFSSLSSARLGMTLTGSDAVGLHGWSFSFESAVDHWDPVFMTSMTFNHGWPTIQLDAAVWNEPRWSWVDETWQSTDAIKVLLDLSADIVVPLRQGSLRFGIGYSLQWSCVQGHPDPDDPTTAAPSWPSDTRTAGVTAYAVANFTRASAWAISPERGISAGVSITGRHRYLGGTGESWVIGGYLNGYLPMPWAGHHVLALLGSGYFSRGDVDNRSVFTVGGFPPQNVFMAIINNEPMHTRHLRGFATRQFSGTATTLVNVEYRFPLAWIHRGFDTLPVAGKKLWATVFGDFGGAWYETFSDPLSVLGFDAGAELALSASLAPGIDMTIRLGYAHGFGQFGQDVVYFRVTP